MFVVGEGRTSYYLHEILTILSTRKLAAVNTNHGAAFRLHKKYQMPGLPSLDLTTPTL